MYRYRLTIIMEDKQEFIEYFNTMAELLAFDNFVKQKKDVAYTITQFVPLDEGVR